MPTGKLNLDLAVADRMAFGLGSGMTHNLDRQETRRLRRTLRRAWRKPWITHPFEDQIGVQPIASRDLRNRYIRRRRLNTDRRSALRSNRWRLRLTSSSDQSRLVRRTTRNPIVSTIQSGHYLTLYKRGRAVRPDGYVRPLSAPWRTSHPNILHVLNLRSRTHAEGGVGASLTQHVNLDHEARAF